MSNLQRLAAVAFSGIAVVAAAVITAADRSAAGTAGGEPPESAGAASGQAAGAEPGLGEPLSVDIAQVSKRIAASEDALRQALEQRITVTFNDEPLEGAIARLAEIGRTRIILDERSLADEGIYPDHLVRAEFEDELLSSVLERLLGRDYPAGWLIENEVIRLTTVEDALTALRSRSYDVTVLSASGFSDEQIARLIHDETAGPWIEVDGTGGSVNIWRGLAIVRQVEAVQREVRDLLRIMTTVAASGAKSGTVPLDPQAGPFRSRTLEALSRAVEIDVRETALEDVLSSLAQQVDLPIRMDRVALATEGIEPGEPVSLRIRGVTLQSALNLILHPLGLVVVGDDRGLRVTSIPCDGPYYSVILVVRDLVQRGNDPDELAELIMTESSGPWEAIDGTGGRIDILPAGLLLVKSTPDVLVEAVGFIEQVRAHADQLQPPTRRTPSLRTQYYPVETLPIADVARAIPKLVSPETWKANGGRGEIAAVGKHLVVRQSPAIHRELREFLKELRSHTGSGPLFGGAW